MKRSGLWLLVGVTVLLVPLLYACEPAKPDENIWAASANSTTVIIDNFAFYPPVLTVARGTTVTWINKYPVAHRVASDRSSPNFTSPNLSTGASFTWTFPQSGNYTYHCDVHPVMKGTIVVQ